MTKEMFQDFDPDLRRAFEFDENEVPEELKDRGRAIKMKPDSLKLSGDGTFATLQGEGPTTGLPCVFCRLHVCNLRCTWCDAYYTWNPKSEQFWTEPRDVPLKEVAQMLEETRAAKFPGEIGKRVIFTGGEPLIQKAQLRTLVEEYLPYEWKVEVETNGTLMPLESQLRDWQFNCSPKLANSENRKGSMVRPKVLRELTKANTTFKFVCRDESDLQEIEDLYLEHIDKDKIIIMPEGITIDEVVGHARVLYEPVMARGWRMMGRFQSEFADGARRRV